MKPPWPTGGAGYLLWNQLTPVAPADAGGQPLRPADEIRKLAPAMLLIIDDQRLRVAGRG
jgi:hypothetical protein